MTLILVIIISLAIPVGIASLMLIIVAVLAISVVGIIVLWLRAPILLGMLLLGWWQAAVPPSSVSLTVIWSLVHVSPIVRHDWRLYDGQRRNRREERREAS
jgi:hypothetical protein